MRLTSILLGTMLLTGIGVAGEPCPVSVRLSNLAAAPPAALFQAKSVARDMFDRIGVTLQWQRSTIPPCGPPIEIQLESGDPGPDRPDSMAYAMPYLEGGARIHVFVGRVAAMVPSNRMGTLLGHVLAHEITHVLQGVGRHSDQGVMKARWDSGDFRAMESHTLPFAATDVLLIRAAAKCPAADASQSPAGSNE